MELKLHSLGGYEPVIYSWPLESKDQECEIIEAISFACQEEQPLQNGLNKILEGYIINNYESIKMVCQKFNRAVDDLRFMIKQKRYEPKSRASVDLLHHILQLCYDKAVTDPAKLNQYEPFSAEVYGETSYELVDQMIKTIRFTEDDRFIDLGSGVGHVVLQVAAATPCKYCYGIEKAQWPAYYAKQLSGEFEKWMKFYGKEHGAYELMKGNFLSDDYKDVISSATVIFVNNFAFGPQVDHELKLRFSNLKEGTKIVSSKAFCAMNMQISERNLSDIGAIMTVEELSPLRGPVSWTPKQVTYFLHTIDRTQLEEYFRKRQNPSQCMRSRTSKSNLRSMMGDDGARRQNSTKSIDPVKMATSSSSGLHSKEVAVSSLTPMRSRYWQEKRKAKKLPSKRPSIISMLSTITAPVSPRSCNTTATSNHLLNNVFNNSNIFNNINCNSSNRINDISRFNDNKAGNDNLLQTGIDNNENFNATNNINSKQFYPKKYHQQQLVTTADNKLLVMPQQQHRQHQQQFLLQQEIQQNQLLLQQRQQPTLLQAQQQHLIQMQQPIQKQHNQPFQQQQQQLHQPHQQQMHQQQHLQQIRFTPPSSQLPNFTSDDTNSTDRHVPLSNKSSLNCKPLSLFKSKECQLNGMSAMSHITKPALTTQTATPTIKSPAPFSTSVTVDNIFSKVSNYRDNNYIINDHTSLQQQGCKEIPLANKSTSKDRTAMFGLSSDDDEEEEEEDENYSADVQQALHLFHLESVKIATDHGYIAQDSFNDPILLQDCRDFRYHCSAHQLRRSNKNANHSIIMTPQRDDLLTGSDVAMFPHVPSSSSAHATTNSFDLVDKQTVLNRNQQINNNNNTSHFVSSQSNMFLKSPLVCSNVKGATNNSDACCKNVESTAPFPSPPHTALPKVCVSFPIFSPITPETPKPEQLPQQQSHLPKWLQQLNSLPPQPQHKNNVRKCLPFNEAAVNSHADNFASGSMHNTNSNNVDMRTEFAPKGILKKSHSIRSDYLHVPGGSTQLSGTTFNSIHSAFEGPVDDKHVFDAPGNVVQFPQQRCFLLAEDSSSISTSTLFSTRQHNMMNTKMSQAQHSTQHAPQVPCNSTTSLRSQDNINSNNFVPCAFDSNTTKQLPSIHVSLPKFLMDDSQLSSDASLNASLQTPSTFAIVTSTIFPPATALPTSTLTTTSATALSTTHTQVYRKSPLSPLRVITSFSPQPVPMDVTEDLANDMHSSFKSHLLTCTDVTTSNAMNVDYINNNTSHINNVHTLFDRSNNRNFLNNMNNDNNHHSSINGPNSFMKDNLCNDQTHLASYGSSSFIRNRSPANSFPSNGITKHSTASLSNPLTCRNPYPNNDIILANNNILQDNVCKIINSTDVYEADNCNSFKNESNNNYMKSNNNNNNNSNSKKLYQQHHHLRHSSHAITSAVINASPIITCNSTQSGNTMHMFHAKSHPGHLGVKKNFTKDGVGGSDEDDDDNDEDDDSPELIAFMAKIKRQYKKALKKMASQSYKEELMQQLLQEQIRQSHLQKQLMFLSEEVNELEQQQQLKQQQLQHLQPFHHQHRSTAVECSTRSTNTSPQLAVHPVECQPPQNETSSAPSSPSQLSSHVPPSLILSQLGQQQPPSQQMLMLLLQERQHRQQQSPELNEHLPQSSHITHSPSSRPQAQNTSPHYLPASPRYPPASPLHSLSSSSQRRRRASSSSPPQRNHSMLSTSANNPLDDAMILRDLDADVSNRHDDDDDVSDNDKDGKDDDEGDNGEYDDEEENICEEICGDKNDTNGECERADGATYAVDVTCHNHINKIVGDNNNNGHQQLTPDIYLVNGQQCNDSHTAVGHNDDVCVNNKPLNDSNSSFSSTVQKEDGMYVVRRVAPLKLNLSFQKKSSANNTKNDVEKNNIVVRDEGDCLVHASQSSVSINHLVDNIEDVFEATTSENSNMNNCTSMKECSLSNQAVDPGRKSPDPEMPLLIPETIAMSALPLVALNHSQQSSRYQSRSNTPVLEKFDDGSIVNCGSQDDVNDVFKPCTTLTTEVPVAASSTACSGICFSPISSCGSPSPVHDNLMDDNQYQKPAQGFGAGALTTGFEPAADDDDVMVRGDSLSSRKRKSVEVYECSSAQKMKRMLSDNDDTLEMRSRATFIQQQQCPPQEITTNHNTDHSMKDGFYVSRDGARDNIGANGDGFLINNNGPIYNFDSNILPYNEQGSTGVTVQAKTTLAIEGTDANVIISHPPSVESIERTDSTTTSHPPSVESRSDSRDSGYGKGSDSDYCDAMQHKLRNMQRQQSLLQQHHSMQQPLHQQPPEQQLLLQQTYNNMTAEHSHKVDYIYMNKKSHQHHHQHILPTQQHLRQHFTPIQQNNLNNNNNINETMDFNKPMPNWSNFHQHVDPSLYAYNNFIYRNCINNDDSNVLSFSSLAESYERQIQSRNHFSNHIKNSSNNHINSIHSDSNHINNIGNNRVNNNHINVQNHSHNSNSNNTSNIFNYSSNLPYNYFYPHNGYLASNLGANADANYSNVNANNKRIIYS